MCIIATKPYGVTSFDWAILKRCFDNNNDGAGFAFSVAGDKHLRYRKGMMTFSAFKTTLEKLVLDRYELANVQLMLHFRITTHGGTRPENTHPFPISGEHDRLKGLKGRADVLCSMNGIVDVDIPKGSDMSDTMHYIKERLPILKGLRTDFFRHKMFAPFIADTGAKWVFMDVNGMEHFGAFNESDGWNYSNYTWDEYSGWNYGSYRYYSIGQKYASGAWTDSAMSLTYGESVPLSQHLEFEGVLITDEGEYIEADKYEDLFISPSNRIYQYCYDTDKLVEVTNIAGVYDHNFRTTTYDILWDKAYKTT